MQALTEPFHYAFMQRAFLCAFLVGVLCASIGTYVVLRKLSFIGDGIAHASFAGIVIAYLRGADYYIGAAIVAVLTALGIGFVHRRGRVALDTAIGVMFTGAFALGIFLMSRQQSYSIDLESFLFGDILSVSGTDLLAIVGLALLVGFTVLFCYRALLYTSFDPIVARASGVAASSVEYVLLVCIALTIVISLQAVGIVLVAALLVTPAAAASQLTRRFTPMLLLSTFFGALCAMGGLYLSYYLRSSSGATIVLCATVLFFLAMGAATALRRIEGRASVPRRSVPEIRPL